MADCAPAVAAVSPPAALPMTADPGTPEPRALPAWPPEPAADDLLEKFKDDLSQPLSTEEKFARALKRSLLPGIITSAGTAGLSMAVDSRLDRDYGMGGKGFVRRWGSYFGQGAVSRFVGDFALASALHQDPRYHPSKKAGFGNRLAHALLAVVVTKTDDGQDEFNSSKLLGLAAGAGAATGWHHDSDRSGSFFAQRFGWSVLSTAGANVLSEFFVYKDEPRK